VARVAIDHVPQLARPAEVERAIEEALALRDRAREASEAVALAQQTVDQLEREDVEAAAARVRAGEATGTPGAALRKAKDALALATRDQAAVGLAQTQAEQDVAQAIVGHAGAWRAELGREIERAREEGRAAIVALRDACGRVGDGLAIKGWVDAGVDSGGLFDRPVLGVWTGSAAPSSRKRTANSESLSATELFDFLGELIDPPTPPARPVLRTAASDAA
jgi:hypothetical protein